MLSIPPPTPSSPALSSKKPKMGTPLNQVFLSKQAMNHPTPALEKFMDQRMLQQPRPTNPLIWCGAILCLIFCLLLIFIGIATVIVVLTIKPRKPVFDTPAARLNLVYFDSPKYFNSDFVFLANFSNPNRNIDFTLEYVNLELYFSDSLISVQGLQPFSMRRGEGRLVPLHMILSLVYLPQNSALELQKQVQTNKVTYNIRGTFKVKAHLGMFHFSYWLHGRCKLDMTSPPNGLLIARSCKTRK